MYPMLTEIKIISVPYMLEIIDEMFDGASPKMTENAFIYGSTVNSILSGLPLVGDLDIATPANELIAVAKGFANSPKWTQVDGPSISEDDPTYQRGYTGATNYAKMAIKMETSSRRKKSDNYEMTLPVSTIVTFSDMRGKRVQIIGADANIKGPEGSLSIIQAVDIRICGLALNNQGDLLEVVPGGYEDCQKRELNINFTAKNLDLNRTLSRINKYVGRGWKLPVSIEEIRQKLNAHVAELEKTEKKKHKPDSHKIIFDSVDIINPTTIIIHGKELNELMDTFDVAHIVNQAVNERGIGGVRINREPVRHGEGVDTNINLPKGFTTKSLTGLRDKIVEVLRYNISKTKM